MFSEDRLPYNQHGELPAKDNVIKTLNPKARPRLICIYSITVLYSNCIILYSTHTNECKHICKSNKNNFKHEYCFQTISIPF